MSAVDLILFRGLFSQYKSIALVLNQQSEHAVTNAHADAQVSQVSQVSQLVVFASFEGVIPLPWIPSISAPPALLSRQLDGVLSWCCNFPSDVLGHIISTILMIRDCFLSCWQHFFPSYVLFLMEASKLIMRSSSRS